MRGLSKFKKSKILKQSRLRELLTLKKSEILKRWRLRLVHKLKTSQRLKYLGLKGLLKKSTISKQFCVRRFLKKSKTSQSDFKRLPKIKKYGISKQFYLKKLPKFTKSKTSKKFTLKGKKSKKFYKKKKSFIFKTWLKKERRKRVYRQDRLYKKYIIPRLYLKMKLYFKFFFKRKIPTKTYSTLLKLFILKKLCKQIQKKKFFLNLLTPRILQKFSNFLKYYLKITNIQLILNNSLKKFQTSIKKNELITHNFIFKDEPQQLITFTPFLKRKFKTLNFQILKQNYASRRLYNNNKLHLIILHFLFKKSMTFYFLAILSMLLKRLKKHTIFISQIRTILSYYFKHYYNQFPIRGLKLSIKGRINGKPRKQHKVLHYGRLENQKLNTLFNYTTTTAYTRYGTFGLKLWRLA